MATGCLSAPKLPEYKGVETFQGRWYHTAQWPSEEVDFAGQQVGVIGTGSSAIQVIPNIARQAAHLFVFQRTPNFSIPAHNAPISPDVTADWGAHRSEYRQQARTSLFGLLIEQGVKSALEVAPEERESEYERRWQRGGLAMYGAYADLLFNQESNDTAAEFVRSKIRSIVRDPAVAEMLVPRDYPLGTKRMCVDTWYYPLRQRLGKQEAKANAFAPWFAPTAIKEGKTGAWLPADDVYHLGKLFALLLCGSEKPRLTGIVHIGLGLKNALHSRCTLLDQ